MFDDKHLRSREDLKLNSISADLDDFEDMVHIYRSCILRYALAALRDKDLAETVTQDCFVRAFNARAYYRGECSVRTWLFAIAKNLIRDHTRSRRFQFWKGVNALAINLSEIENQVAGGQGSPEDSLILREQLRRMWSRADELSEAQRAVFLLRYEEDLDLSEIALLRGVSLNTVKSQLCRAVAAIRHRME